MKYTHRIQVQGSAPSRTPDLASGTRHLNPGSVELLTELEAEELEAWIAATKTSRDYTVARLGARRRMTEALATALLEPARTGTRAQIIEYAEAKLGLEVRGDALELYRTKGELVAYLVSVLVGA